MLTQDRRSNRRSFLSKTLFPSWRSRDGEIQFKQNLIVLRPGAHLCFSVPWHTAIQTRFSAGKFDFILILI